MNRFALTLALIALFPALSLFAEGAPEASNKPASAAPQAQETAKTLLAQGAAAFEQQDYQAAIAAYTKAIELEPDYAEAYAYRGRAYSYLPDSFDQVAADCEKAIGLNPNIAEAYFALGRVYQNKGDIDAAIENYTKAVEIKPDYVFAWNNRGNAYQAKGELDLSIADYTNALHIDQGFAMAYFNRGSVYYAKGELDLAIADYTKAMQLDPEDIVRLLYKYIQIYYNKLWLTTRNIGDV